MVGKSSVESLKRPEHHCLGASHVLSCPEEVTYTAKHSLHPELVHLAAS